MYLLLEDTAIENFVHAKCQKEWDDNIEHARNEALEHLYNEIEDVENRHIYKELIHDLVQYCLVSTNALVDTRWDDSEQYKKHIEFIKDFQKIYYSDPTLKIEYLLKPFGGLLSADLQEYILKIKYNNELKYWKLYEFAIKHTNLVIEYLNMKLLLS